METNVKLFEIRDRGRQLRECGTVQHTLLIIYMSHDILTCLSNVYKLNLNLFTKTTSISFMSFIGVAGLNRNIFH